MLQLLFAAPAITTPDGLLAKRQGRLHQMTGILSLPPQAAKQREGELYLCFLQSPEEVARLLLGACRDQHKSRFIAQCSQAFFLDALPTDLQESLHTLFQSHYHQAYFWRPDRRGDAATTLAKLRADLARLYPAKGSVVTLCVSEAAFDALDPAALAAQLRSLRRNLAQRRCRALMLIYGQHQSLRPLLMQCNELIAGMATLQRIGQQQFHYALHYWRSEFEVIADRQYSLQLNDEGLLEAQPEPPKTNALNSSDLGGPTRGIDADAIYICQQAVQDADSQSALGQSFSAIYPSNTALLEQLPPLVSATVVLACSDTEQVQELASQCFLLRQRSGGGLKLMVRETRDCLRYSDEQYLIRAGVNLVVPHTLVFSLFMSQLEALQGQLFTRPLPADLDALLQSWPANTLRGYFEPADFVRHSRRALAHARHSDIDDVLVQLTPARGIPAAHCLSLCDIRRDGDMITVCDGEIFLLFRACRVHDVGAAMRSCFALPSEEIFAIQAVFYNATTMEQMLSYIANAQDYLDAASGQRLLRKTPVLRQQQQIAHSQRHIAQLARPATLQIKA